MNYIECPKCGNREPAYDYAHLCGPLEVKQADPVRQAFETVCYPNFPGQSHGLRRRPSGEYVSDSLEDHWQTFQEGWEYAIAYVNESDNPQYSGIISDGGMDPR